MENLLPMGLDSSSDRQNRGHLEQPIKDGCTCLNPPVATPVFFYLLAGIMVIGGILVITRKKCGASALALIHRAAGAGRNLSDAYAPFAPAYKSSLCWRHHGAVPVCDHADQP